MHAEWARIEALPLSQRPIGQRRPPTIHIFALFFIAFPIAVVVGIALFVVSSLLGLPAGVIPGATLVGLIGGWFLCWVFDESAWTVVDRLADRIDWVDRRGGDVLGFVSNLTLLIPAAVTLVVWLVLLSFTE